MRLLVSSPSYSPKEEKKHLFRITLFWHNVRHSDFVLKCQWNTRVLCQIHTLTKKRIKKRLRFRELEVGAVQLFGSYVLFLRNPYLFLLQRKLKNQLYLMNRKCQDVFFHKAAGSSQFLAHVTQQIDRTPCYSLQTVFLSLVRLLWIKEAQLT